MEEKRSRRGGFGKEGGRGRRRVRTGNGSGGMNWLSG